MESGQIAMVIGVGIVWGVTNAFMEKGTTSTDAETTKTDPGLLSKTKNIFTNWRFLLPFLLNQSASLANNFVIGASDITVVIPVVNCVTFIFTFITQQIMDGESIFNWRFIMGCLMIMAGIYLCTQ
jgi:hypothetical protein